MIEKLTNHKTVFTKAEGNRLQNSDLCRAAFTLAEVLITLSVIGIVAILTIPAMVKNHNEKAWSTAKDVFEKKLEVAARQMNTEEKLTGYESTLSFVNELRKYIKITKVCDSNELTKCFEKSVIWNEDEDPVDISIIKNANNMGQDDWGTEVIGVQFSNGVNALIAYNPNTKQDPFNNQFAAVTNSMAILYDISGHKNPNTNGKDIGSVNVTKLGNVVTCLQPISEVMGTCVTQTFPHVGGYSPLTAAECEAEKDKLGIESCHFDNDYWAGAVKACGGIDKMPTKSQLNKLAEYVYPSTASGSGGMIFCPDDAQGNRTKCILTDKLEELGFSSSGFSFWSNEYTSEEAWEQHATEWDADFFGCYRNYTGMDALCVNNN